MMACGKYSSSSTLVVLILLTGMLGACGDGSAGSIPAPPVATADGAPAAYSVVRTVEYEVVERLAVVNEGPGQPDKQNLWMALIRDLPPYQTVASVEIAPASYQIVTDEYGNRYAEFDLADIPPTTTVPLEIRYRVAVNELEYDLAGCEGEVPDAFTRAELHIESNNPQIVALARELAEGRRSTCEQVRAFYDYVGNSLVYSYNGADWGAQAALGHMGSDCTEYASLLIALCRAEGIPARYVEGLWVGDEGDEGTGRTEHAWSEVYLPGAGWVPVDPTLGRSSLSREQHFAHYTPDHIAVTVGRNPSTLRGASYWTHLYWPGASTMIRVEGFGWEIRQVGESGP